MQTLRMLIYSSDSLVAYNTEHVRPCCTSLLHAPSLAQLHPTLPVAAATTAVICLDQGFPHLPARLCAATTDADWHAYIFRSGWFAEGSDCKDQARGQCPASIVPHVIWHAPG